MNGQLPEVGRAEVRQFVLLPVGPQILDRVEFRRIARKIFQPQTSALLLYELPHRAAAMTGQSVPNDQQLAGNVPQQVREKLDDLRAADRSRKQPEIEVPPRHPRYRRQGLPVEVILQNRRLSARRPSAAAMGALAQSAFVDEDEGPAFVFGLFFNSGQRCRFHC